MEKSSENVQSVYAAENEILSDSTFRRIVDEADVTKVDFKAGLVTFRCPKTQNVVCEACESCPSSQECDHKEKIWDVEAIIRGDEPPELFVAVELVGRLEAEISEFAKRYQPRSADDYRHRSSKMAFMEEILFFFDSASEDLTPINSDVIKYYRDCEEILICESLWDFYTNREGYSTHNLDATSKLIDGWYRESLENNVLHICEPVGFPVWDAQYKPLGREDAAALIEALKDELHNDSGSISKKGENFYQAMMRRDADGMIRALTGWDCDGLLELAKQRRMD